MLKTKFLYCRKTVKYNKFHHLKILNICSYNTKYDMVLSLKEIINNCETYDTKFK